MASEDSSRSAGSKPPPVRTRRPGAPPVRSGQQGVPQSSRTVYQSAQTPQSGSRPGVRSTQTPQPVPRLGVWTTQTPQSGSRLAVRSTKASPSSPRPGVHSKNAPQSIPRLGVWTTQTPQSGTRSGVRSISTSRRSSAVRTTAASGAASASSSRPSADTAGIVGQSSFPLDHAESSPLQESLPGSTAHSTRTAVPRTWRYFRWSLRPAEKERAAFRWRALLCGLAAAALYAAAFSLLSVPLNRLTAQWSPAASALTRSFIPALLGTIICAAPWPLMDWDPRVLLSAYRRLSILSALSFVCLQALVWGDWETQALTIHFYATFLLCPLLLGMPVSLLLCFLWWIHPDADEYGEEEEDIEGKKSGET